MNEGVDQMFEKSPRPLLLSILCIVLALASASGLQSHATKMNGLAFSPPQDSPVTVKDENLDSLVKLYSPFVVDCWKIGCESCEAFNPTFDELAKDLKGQVVFGKLCIDKNRKTKEKYHISGYPTLLVFKNGALVYSRVGNSPKSTLKDLIQSKLGLPASN
jgi:thioredoxin 1